MDKNPNIHRHEKDLGVSLLLDCYGELLSETKRRAVELYYNDDLSLAEIAEDTGVTRQGVRDSIEKARSQLYLYEEKLGLARRMREVDTLINELTAKLLELRNTVGDHTEQIDELISMVKRIGTIFDWEDADVSELSR
ncbi:MAG TPA: DNA-binding protein [Firmicutes bacterium]|nr:DNA-binding protein [Bacillota bacterium]